MGYGRLGPTDPGGSGRQNNPDTSHSSHAPPGGCRSQKKLILFSLIAAVILVCSAVSAAVIILHKPTRSATAAAHRQPTQAISRTCSRTRFPDLCVQSLLDFPGTAAAGERDLVHISVNMTLQHISRALYSAADFSAVQMETRVRSAFDACIELLEDSVDALSMSLLTVAPSPSGGEPAGSTQDVLTWLSAALTNQDTCTDGFDDVAGSVKDKVSERLKDSAELISNCLAIFSAADGGDFFGVPIQNRRRRLLKADISGANIGGSPKQLLDSPVPEIFSEEKIGEFPQWLNRRERRLLELPVSEIQADIVVSKDGNGTVKTITEAIKKAPQHSKRRIIIYVRAGRYEEKIIKVGRKKINLMFIGDGKGKTVISGGKSVFDNITTFHTASFAATGAGFIARDMTFENWAGPEKHQAVALRVGADHAVVYRCNIIGYQDSLYVHSKRQFFRECDIYGTVDFIFGNAAVVLQNCSIYARKPMDLQKITVTAQNRKDPNQNTGISIHACQILAAADLIPFKDNISTYLGRPWKLYSRVVYMLSYIGDHVDRRGWLEWNGTFALDTLYYGEYMNYGPGGGVGQRVKWPGYRVITSLVEAKRFTVSEFIGSSWLPATGVAFLAGLAV